MKKSLGLQNLRIIVHTNRYRPISVYIYFKYISVPSGNIIFFYKPQTKLKPSQADILPVLSQNDSYVITFEPFVRFSNFEKVKYSEFCKETNSICQKLEILIMWPRPHYNLKWGPPQNTVLIYFLTFKPLFCNIIWG